MFISDQSLRTDFNLGSVETPAIGSSLEDALPKRIYDGAYASLRFYSETLDPLNVTLALRLPPDRTYRKGEPRLRRHRKTGEIREYGLQRLGMWGMSSKEWVKSPQLSVHLDWLLKQIESKSEAVAKILKHDVKADFFCFSSGNTKQLPSLPGSIRQRASKLKIMIDIDHYDTTGSSA